MRYKELQKLPLENYIGTYTIFFGFGYFVMYRDHILNYDNTLVNTITIIIDIIVLVTFGILIPFIFYKKKVVTEIDHSSIKIVACYLKQGFVNIQESIDIKNIDNCKTHTLKTSFLGFRVKTDEIKKSFDYVNSKGVLIELKNREKIFIGSKEPRKLKEAIDRILILEIES